MSKGLAVPIRVGPNGGALVLAGDENDEKILLLALGDDDNENAFQQNIGLGVGMIFDVNDALLRGRILARMRQIFRRFELLKRFKMLENTVRWDDDEGDAILSFKYINLESDEEKEFKRRFSSPQALNK